MKKPVKIHGMPVKLWCEAKSLAALAGITVSQYVIRSIWETIERSRK